jgi:hypothetical protein
MPFFSLTLPKRNSIILAEKKKKKKKKKIRCKKPLADLIGI